MELIGEPRAVLEELERVKRASRDWVTNYYPNAEALGRWIEAGALSMDRIAGNAFLFLREEDFLRLFYISPSREALGQGLEAVSSSSGILVTEVIARADEIPGLAGSMPAHGFHPYATLVRLSMGRRPESGGEGLEEGVRFASEADAPEIRALLTGFFDRFAERLQSPDEIGREVAGRRMLVCESGGRVAGFLHFEISGFTSHLRRWFVHPDYRELRVGSRLLQSYFSLSGRASRFILWVLRSNENAIKRYVHFGYREDGLTDAIFTNRREMRYGG